MEFLRNKTNRRAISRDGDRGRGKEIDVLWGLCIIGYPGQEVLGSAVCKLQNQGKPVSTTFSPSLTRTGTRSTEQKIDVPAPRGKRWRIHPSAAFLFCLGSQQIRLMPTTLGKPMCFTRFLTDSEANLFQKRSHRHRSSIGLAI